MIKSGPSTCKDLQLQQACVQRMIYRTDLGLCAECFNKSGLNACIELQQVCVQKINIEN